MTCLQTLGGLFVVLKMKAFHHVPMKMLYNPGNVLGLMPLYGGKVLQYIPFILIQHFNDVLTKHENVIEMFPTMSSYKKLSSYSLAYTSTLSMNSKVRIV